MVSKLEKICDVVRAALLEATNRESLSEPITASSEMGSPKEWDSLAFVHIFLAVTQHFELDADDDDAIHFTSIAKIEEFMESF